MLEDRLEAELARVTPELVHELEEFVGSAGARAFPLVRAQFGLAVVLPLGPEVARLARGHVVPFGELRPREMRIRVAVAHDRQPQLVLAAILFGQLELDGPDQRRRERRSDRLVVGRFVMLTFEDALEPGAQRRGRRRDREPRGGVDLDVVKVEQELASLGRPCHCAPHRFFEGDVFHALVTLREQGHGGGNGQRLVRCAQ